MSDRKTFHNLYDELPEDIDVILQLEIGHIIEVTSQLHKQIKK